jgi:hypothetical protein
MRSRKNRVKTAADAAPSKHRSWKKTCAFTYVNLAGALCPPNPLVAARQNDQIAKPIKMAVLLRIVKDIVRSAKSTKEKRRAVASRLPGNLI